MWYIGRKCHDVASLVITQSKCVVEFRHSELVLEFRESNAR